MDIAGKVIPATEESFLLVRDKLSKFKKLSIDFNQSIANDSAFKFGDRILLT
jgi:hypothetical protein